jgi:hypothetical protein
MSASGDCELIRNGFWGQPVNAVSSLAFVAVGLALARTRPVIGWLACGVGVGSFLFHGPMPPWAQWAHDTTLAILVVGLIFERRLVLLLAAGGLVALVIAVLPTVAEPLTIALAVIAVFILSKNRQLVTARAAAAAAILGVSGTIAVLSRTGGPLCRPNSLLQAHALWHLGAAAALLVWAREPSRPAGPTAGQASRASTSKGPSR